jgi:hypothetical protein
MICNREVIESNRARNLEAVRSYISEWKSHLDLMGIWVIEPDARLFDSIAFSLLNKAYGLGNACALLIDGKFNDEAYGLSRSMIECALNLRYLTLDQNKTCLRSNNYFNFYFEEQTHFLTLLRRYVDDKDVLKKIEARAKCQGIGQQCKSAKPKNVSDWKALENRELKWWKIVSEKHPLDEELNPRCSIQELFSVEYRASSAMVHCSIRSLDNYFAVGSYAYKVGETHTNYDHSVEPLMLVVDCLYLAAQYALFGVYGVDYERDRFFDDLLDHTSKNLVYQRQS